MSERADLTMDAVEPGSPDPRQAAREQFVHGLLETMHRDRREDTDRRLAAVMARIEAPIPFRDHAPRRRPWRLVSGMAAGVILVAAAMLSLPSQRSALAMVQASIAASRTAGDRGYEIRVTIADAEHPVTRSLATLDVRDPSHYLLRITADNGEKITMGRNADGEWAIKKSGEIDRTPPKWLLPQWVSFGGSTMMLTTVDDVLARLEGSYDLKRRAPEATPTGVRCDRVTAALKSRPSADPGRVELWLDPRTKVVRRIEMVWDGTEGGDVEHRQGGPRGGRGGRPPPDGRRPPPHEGGPLPPGEDAPPGDRPSRPRPPSLDRFSATPRTALFELAGGGPFADGWFDPATHGGYEPGTK
jgi:hypothetical protein